MTTPAAPTLPDPDDDAPPLVEAPPETLIPPVVTPR